MGLEEACDVRREVITSAATSLDSIMSAIFVAASRSTSRPLWLRPQLPYPSDAVSMIDSSEGFAHSDF